ncbi:hypothetical protein NIES4106_57830 (plasmid) [Fischerella sp. NIES-4106]|nr:hypothetical protein NIES4106_57830 [Fischerella sp. NIES-4106]
MEIETENRTDDRLLRDYDFSAVIITETQKVKI